MEHPRHVGVILFGGPGPIFETVRDGLAHFDYVEGRNIVVEPRYAEGQLDRVAEFAAELARRDVDVIVAVGAVAARAAQQATTNIPVVFAVVIDPIAAGFAATLERPGGNLTGITSFDPRQPGDQFALLKEVLPTLSRVALLSDQDIPPPLERANDAAARALGLQPLLLRVKGPSPDLEDAFSAMIQYGAAALVVLEVPVTIMHQKRIAELAAMHRLPTLFPGGYSSAGGLITFGTTLFDTLPRLPGYVHKILNGAKPGDLPVDVTPRRELIFNVKTARSIGVTIPPELLKRADQVIE